MGTIIVREAPVNIDKATQILDGIVTTLSNRDAAKDRELEVYWAAWLTRETMRFTDNAGLNTEETPKYAWEYILDEGNQSNEICLPPDWRVFKFNLAGKLISTPRGKKERQLK